MIFFLFMNLDTVCKNSTPRASPYSTFEWAGILAMKFEVMQNQKFIYALTVSRIPASDLNWHNIKSCSNKFPATKTSFDQKQDLVDDYQN